MTLKYNLVCFCFCLAQHCACSMNVENSKTTPERKGHYTKKKRKHSEQTKQMSCLEVQFVNVLLCFCFYRVFLLVEDVFLYDIRAFVCNYVHRVSVFYMGFLHYFVFKDVSLVLFPVAVS